jgi:hypothetical protein
VKRTIVIGDVHGCADELDALLREVGHDRQDDVVLVGDLVAKGPDSRGVLARVRDLGLRSVCGNHDAHVLRYVPVLAGAPEPRMSPGHLKVARELDARDFELLSSLPLWITLPDALLRQPVLVVHAGLVPGVPLEAQDRELLLNLRSIRQDGTGSRRPDEGVAWGSVWPGPELVMFGHHAAQGLQVHPFAIGLDTGCVYGRELTAYVLPERRFVRVQARKAYAPVTREPMA